MATMDELSAHVFVSGRVQGVWFRESTRRRALELGVGGWVRNLPDGRVEALFEGDAAAVRAAVAFVREGPPMARVESLEVDERPRAAGAPPSPSFEVR
jgi:acylphosphatase